MTVLLHMSEVRWGKGGVCISQYYEKHYEI